MAENQRLFVVLIILGTLSCVFMSYWAYILYYKIQKISSTRALSAAVRGENLPGSFNEFKHLVSNIKYVSFAIKDIRDAIVYRTVVIGQPH